MSVIKEEAHKVIEDLPEDATWDDLMYKLYVQQKIEPAFEPQPKGGSFPMSR